ncbi:kinase-like protein [Apiospora saccharicola]
MASLLRRLPWPGRAWRPITFSNPNFTRISLDEKIEEELFPDYVASHYYPVRVGEVLRDRYQIVGKLGFGATSTVWLARDLDGRRHVTLKLVVNSESMGKQLEHELSMYRHISSSVVKHPDREAVRNLLDSFDVAGPDGSHRCLVHPPLWESALTFLHRNPVRRLPSPVLAFILRRLFLAMDFLHSECQIIHTDGGADCHGTDIKADNIMFGINDDSVFTKFEEQELHDPSPRKLVDDGRVIYLSRELQMPKDWGAPVLCDFGSAVIDDKEHLEDVQPDVYRAPEVILEASWSNKIDIWNTGCMDKTRSTRHTAVAPTLQKSLYYSDSPPKALLQSGKSSHKFFTDQERETQLEGENRKKFLAMMWKMLQWDPVKRSSAKELAEDEWIMDNI